MDLEILDARQPGPVARSAVTRLYQEHATGLVRLAHVMLGDPAEAQDVVQDAFCGLYRRWDVLSDQAKALQYVRSAVLNGCRSVLRDRARRQRAGGGAEAGIWVPDMPSAEAAVLDGEGHRAVMTALRRLPDRQREAVVLRYYLDLPGPEIATVMGISYASVRSALSRALETLGRLLGETHAGEEW